MEDNSSNSAPVGKDAPSESVNNEGSETSDGQETPIVAAQPPSTKKKYKLNVDGKEEDFELDLADEKEVAKHLQMSKAAMKRMQEAAITQQRAEKFIEMLQKDPGAVLSNPKLGVDVRKFAEEYLMKQLQEEMLTPEQKRIRDADEIIRERDEQVAKTKQDAEQAQIQKLQDHYAKDYETKIMTALQGESIPKTPKTVHRMAELMKKNLQHGLDLEPAQIAQMVKDEYLSEFKEVIGAIDGETLLKIFGEDTSNKIRKADLARLKGPVGHAQATSKSEAPRQAKTERKPMTKDQWREALERRTKG